MPSKTVEQRFWVRVSKGDPDDCWIWQASKSNGYGRFAPHDRMVPAHRWAYEQAHGTIPDGLQLDHLCRNRACVNPAHLEPVTQRVNILRGKGPTAANARKSHCTRGHALSGDNLAMWFGKRYCRACQRIARRKRHLRERVGHVIKKPRGSQTWGNDEREVRVIANREGFVLYVLAGDPDRGGGMWQQDFCDRYEFRTAPRKKESPNA